MRLAILLLSIVPATCAREVPRVVEVRVDSVLVQLGQGSRPLCTAETGPRCMAQVY